MLDSFAGYVTGEQCGRKAFPLPTGMGKTAAVVAFIAALDRCGYAVPVSVAASQVQALCAIHASLLAHNVPLERIGLKHSLRDAAVPSTGDAERLYQLVTHARVRGGTDFALFGTYRGRRRALCLYDETLWRADTVSLRADDAQGAVAWALHRAPPEALGCYLRECLHRIGVALQVQPAGSHGVPFDLPAIEEGQEQEWAEWIATSGAADKGVSDDLLQLMKLAGESLWVLATEQGKGVVSIRQAIPSGLLNVAILDASAPIRELARLDSSVAVQDLGGQSLKSFERVEVAQYLAGGGRSTLATRGRRDASPLAREVAGIIDRDLLDDAQRCFLLFTYMRRGRDDPQAQLRADLRHLGVDLHAVASDGAPRFSFLTWGQHEGLNGYERCTSVILAGVLQRDHLSLAAAIKGQQDDPTAPTPGRLVRTILESEVAHAVYQAASRGSCRTVNDGKAHAMRLHVIHRHQELKALLDPVMPGAQWFYPDLDHLSKAIATGKGDAMLGRVLAALKTISAETRQVSSRKLKEAMGSALDGATKDIFTSAMRRVDPLGHGWEMRGRSLVRAT